MPFQSKAQEKFMFAKHPQIAQQWANEFPQQNDLPDHVKKRRVKPEIQVKSAWLNMKTQKLERGD